jgi:hypothetical protein
MFFKTKKGDVEIGFLIWMAIGLLVLLVSVTAFIYAKNHGTNLIDYIKSFFTFG